MNRITDYKITICADRKCDGDTITVRSTVVRGGRAGYIPGRKNVKEQGYSGTSPRGANTPPDKTLSQVFHTPFRIE